MSRVRGSLASVLTLAAVLCAAVEAPAQPKPLGKVTVGLGVAKTFTFLPAYVAEDLGAWKKRGLEVEIVPFAGDAKLQQGFAAGSVDFEAGKRADLVLLTRRAPELTPLADVANALVYATDGRNVDTVIVDGRPVMEGRRVLTIDEEALYGRVRGLAPRLVERAGLRPRPRWPVS